MPVMLLSPIDRALVRSVSVRVIAVVKAASGVIDKAPVASKVKLLAVMIRSSPAAFPPSAFKVKALLAAAVISPAPTKSSELMSRTVPSMVMFPASPSSSMVMAPVAPATSNSSKLLLAPPLRSLSVNRYHSNLETQKADPLRA